MFMKEKPGKYGILIRILADAETRYILNMEVYAGKSNSTREERGPSAIVKRLVKPISNSGRNVTTDRFYTSVELAEDLWNEFHLTLVGTLQANRRHIPETLKTTSSRERYSLVFAFTDPRSHSPPVTLVSYMVHEKPKKVVILFSTQHQDAAIVEEDKRKPEIVHYYNATKGGIDTIDQMARAYSAKRGTRRWPLSLFHTLIDIAAINSFTVYTMNCPEWMERKRNRRRLYLIELGKMLVKPQVEERSRNLGGLQKQVIMSMEQILERELFQAGDPGPTPTEGRGRCYLCCGEAKSKKAKYSSLSWSKQRCAKCSRHVCTKHSKRIFACLKCGEDPEESE